MMWLLLFLACDDKADTATAGSGTGITFTNPDLSPVSFSTLGSAVWLDAMVDGDPVGAVLVLSESEFSCERVRQLITIGYLDEDIDPALLMVSIAWQGGPLYGELSVDGYTLGPEGGTEIQLLAYDEGIFWSFDWAGGGVLSLTEGDATIEGTLETIYVTADFAATRCEAAELWGGG